MKILFLQKRLLFPHNTGGKIRSLGVLRFLAKRHDVAVSKRDRQRFVDDYLESNAVGVVPLFSGGGTGL